MSHNVRDKYIEPMAKGEKSHKRVDSGYGGSTSDRSSRRYSGSRRSTESTKGSRGYVEPEVSIARQRFDPSALQNALDAAHENIETLEKENHDLDNDLKRSNSERRRFRRERDAERAQNDELRASLTLANREIEAQRKELAKYKKDSKKSSSKTGSKETWKEMPVPLYREQSPSPEPEMPRNSRPTSNSSRPSRRMSMSTNTPSTYTYPLRPGNNYDRYSGQ